MAYVTLSEYDILKAKYRVINKKYKTQVKVIQKLCDYISISKDIDPETIKQQVYAEVRDNGTRI